MNLEKQIDLTEGPVLAMLTRLALPILGTSFLQMAYNLTDIFWLGRLSAESMAGAGIGGFVLWILSSVGGLTRSAAIIQSSQGKGSKDEAGMRQTACLALFWTLVLGVVASVSLTLAPGRIVGLFHLQESAAVLEGVSFIRVCGAGSVFLLLFPMMSALCIGWGDSRTPFWVSLFTVALNIVLDPLFIFTFGMKAAGAALATIIANALGTLILLWNFATTFQDFTRFSHYLNQSRRFLTLGLPQCAEGVIYASFSMMVGTLLGAFGPSVLAANSLGAQVESLTWMVAIGLSSAATSFCGQNWGGKQHERIRKGYFSVLTLAIAYASAIGLAFTLFPDGLARIFSNQPEIIAKSREYFTILALSQPFMAVELTIAGCFRGIQRPGLPSVISILVTMARLPLASLLLRAGYGYQAVWWVISGTSILKGIIIAMSFLPCHSRQQKLMAGN